MLFLSSPSEIFPSGKRSVLSLHCCHLLSSSFFLPHFPWSPSLQSFDECINVFHQTKKSLLSNLQLTVILNYGKHKNSNEKTSPGSIYWLGPKVKLKNSCMFWYVLRFWSPSDEMRSLNTGCLFLGHSLFSGLCPMKLSTGRCSGVCFQCVRMKHGQISGGVWEKASLAKSLSEKKKSEDSSHHLIYLLSGRKNEGHADKNNLGKLLIPTIDNIKFLSGTWGFSLYQINTVSFSTRDYQIPLKAMGILITLWKLQFPIFSKTNI